MNSSASSNSRGLDWRAFRKADAAARLAQVQELISADPPAAAGDARARREAALRAAAGGFVAPRPELVEMADALVENAIGVMAIPLGIAGGFLIDGRERQLPLASEEPSVIAAASFGATIIARHGGFLTWATEPVMSAQLWVAGEGLERAAAALSAAEERLAAALAPTLKGMVARGGGWRGMDCAVLPLEQGGSALREGPSPAPAPALRLQFHLDTRDAMGANLLNTCAETLRPLVEEISGAKVVLAILSNAAARRRAGARCSLPLDGLGRAGLSGPELGARIALATRIADNDPGRGVTHNKGIMNGISALALATGNDTRAIEAGAHAWASRSGSYRALSDWWVADGCLEGRIELPLAFGTVGGAAAYHPAARLALRVAGTTDASELARLAAALGLAQNFAALQALCGEGIQSGHMQLHSRREAWMARRFDP